MVAVDSVRVGVDKIRTFIKKYIYRNAENQSGVQDMKIKRNRGQHFDVLLASRDRVATCRTRNIFVFESTEGAFSYRSVFSMGRLEAGRR